MESIGGALAVWAIAWAIVQALRCERDETVARYKWYEAIGKEYDKDEDQE